MALGDQRRVVVGLPSLAVPTGDGATGPHDIGFGLGSAWLTVGFGFTNIIDIAVDSTGAGYVLEHDADGLLGPGGAGRLVRVSTNGTQTVLSTAGLVRPGGIAIGPDGAL